MQRYPALVTTLTRLGIGIFGRTQKALCRSLLAELSMIYALKGDPDWCVMDPKIWARKRPFVRWWAALRIEEERQCPERVRIRHSARFAISPDPVRRIRLFRHQGLGCFQ